MKLTTGLIKRLIREERAKLSGKPESTEKKAKQTKEVDADKLADTLENPIDHMKALKIKEAIYTKALRKLDEAKKAKALAERKASRPKTATVTMTESELRNALAEVRKQRKSLVKKSK